MRKISIFLSIFILLSLVSVNSGFAWLNDSWDYRSSIAFTSPVAETLVDFPTFLSINTSTLYDEGKLQSDCDDLRFTNSEGVEIPYELEECVVNGGNSSIWVKMNQTASTTSIIYMYYGNSGASDGQDTENVWDDNYLAVYHFNEDSGNITDSTSQNNDANYTVGVDYDYGGCNFGKCIFINTSGEDDYISIPDTDNDFDQTNAWTLEMWVNLSSQTIHRLFQKRQTGFNYPIIYMFGAGVTDTILLGIDDGSFHGFGWTPTGSVDTNIWYYDVGRWDNPNDQLRWNRNYTETLSTTVTQTGSVNNDPVTIGLDYNGIPDTTTMFVYDELRYSDIERSDAWISATHQLGTGNFTPDIFEQNWTAMLINIESPTNTTYYNSSVWFNVTGNTDISSCRMNLDGTNYTLKEYNSTKSVLKKYFETNGNHNVTFYCNNTLGIENSTDTVYFTTELPTGVWWDSDWGYKKKLTFNDNGESPKEHWTWFKVNTSDLYNNGKLQSDCDDLRFVDEGGNTPTPLNYKIEYCGINGDNSSLYVELDWRYMDETIIYMYYGEGDVSTTESNVTKLHKHLASATSYDSKNCFSYLNGSTYCWGLDTWGTLFNNKSTAPPNFNYQTPQANVFVQNVRQMAMGTWHTAMLLDNQTIISVGKNDKGQLGNGNNTNMVQPVYALGLDNAIQVDAGYWDSCAVTENMTSYCWGYNWGGQTTYPNENINPNYPYNRYNYNVTQVSVSAGSGMHHCVLTAEGDIYCVGDGSKGQLGYGGTIGFTYNYYKVNGLDNVGRQISAGEQHSCAIAKNGSAYCWGINTYGQLGDGTISQRNVPTLVSGLDNVRKIVTGDWHTCAIAGNGTGYCWGDNYMGKLGIGNVTDMNVPVETVGNVEWLDIEAGNRWGTIGLATNGTFYCWGDDKGCEVETTIPKPLSTNLPDLFIRPELSLLGSEEYLPNNAPVLTIQELYPANPKTNDDLTLNVSCYDIDSGQTLTVYWSIYKDSTNMTSLAGSQVVSNNTETTVFTINSGNTSKSEDWKGAFIYCSDSLNMSSVANTTTRTIGNTAPTVSLNSPLNESVLTRQLFAVLDVTPLDDDADSMDVTFYNNGTGATLCTNSTIANGTSVKCNWTSLTAGTEYCWHVNVTDGTDNGFGGKWCFTPDDEPLTLNMRAENITNTSIIFKWNNEADMVWISLQLGSDILELRKLTGTENNWTISPLYRNSEYNFTWQLGDAHNEFSDYHSFLVRTAGWKPELNDWGYKRLITVTGVTEDKEDYSVNITLDENTFDFTHANWTNGNDFRFLNFEETEELPYNITYWLVNHNGGKVIQETPNETYCEGNWVNCSMAYDGDWNSQAYPQLGNTSTLYINYTIQNGAKNSSTWRLYDGGWYWDGAIPDNCLAGEKLRFKLVSHQSDTNPYVISYCQDNGDNSWTKIRNNSEEGSPSYYIYEEMVTWYYEADASFLVKPKHFKDVTQSNEYGVDGNYTTKLWMYYGNSEATAQSNSSITYAGIWNDTTLGSEVGYIAPVPIISNVTESNQTSTSITIDWIVDLVVDNRLKYATNEWLVGGVYTSRLLNVTETFEQLKGDDEHTKLLIYHSDDYERTISVACSNSSYNDNYTLNTTADPMEITFLDVGDATLLNWTVVYEVNKSWERTTGTPEFLLLDLPTNTKYYYEVQSYGEVGNASERGDFTLGTPPSTPSVVILNYTEDRPNKKVRICGNLTDLNGQSNIKCYFEYFANATIPPDEFQNTSYTTKNAVGEFCFDADVEYGNDYIYRAVAEGTTTGYSDSYTNEFMAVQPLFAGNTTEDDNDGRSRQYCVNLATQDDCYEMTGYWEGSQQEETTMWIETNLTDRGTLHLKWWNGTAWSDVAMSNTADMWYKNMTGLGSDWHTFEVWNDTNMVLNWTKPDVVHPLGGNRTDRRKYVSFNGTPESIDYDLLYMTPVNYTGTAYRHCMAHPQGNLYDCMAVEYYGGGAEAGLTSEMTGSAYDRGRLFRGGIINGEAYDSGVLNSVRDTTLPLGSERYCFAFTLYHWNETIVPDNNITNYYVRYWTMDNKFSEYFGYQQSRLYDFDAVFKWQFDYLSQTRDWSAIERTKSTSNLVLNVGNDTFNSTYNQSLNVEHISFDGVTVDGNYGDEIYNMGLILDGRWSNQQIGKYQQGFVILNLPDNTTLQGMDSDSDGLNDYDELFVYYTNPKSNDTDEGGQTDYNEVTYGTNPNIFLDDNNPPTTEDPKEPTDPTAYFFGQGYQFNVTVCDDDGVEDLNTVSFEFNNVNHTVSTNSSINSTCAEFYTTVSNYGAGTYNWTWFANDSINQPANIQTGNFTISKTFVKVNAYVDNNPVVSLVNRAESIEFKGDVNSTYNVNLTFNFNDSAYGDNFYSEMGTVVTNTTNTESFADWVKPNTTYNFTVSFDGDNNYTADSDMVTVYVQEYPVISLTLNFSSIDFGNMNHNTQNNSADNEYKVTIGSKGGCSGNVVFLPFNPILTKGGYPVGYNISNTNVKMNYTSNSSYTGGLEVLNSNRTASLNDDDDVELYPYYYLDVPSGQHDGSYTGTHTIVGECT